MEAKEKTRIDKKNAIIEETQNNLQFDPKFSDDNSVPGLISNSTTHVKNNENYLNEALILLQTPKDDCDLGLVAKYIQMCLKSFDDIIEINKNVSRTYHKQLENIIVVDSSSRNWKELLMDS